MTASLEMLKLRKAVPHDISLIHSFIKELAEYEREPAAVHSTETDLQRDGFGPNPIFKVVIAEWDGLPAGMALYYYYYSTWAGHPGIFLEDLYVRPQYRKKRVGMALMSFLAQTAVKEKCHGLRWEVLDWNKSAIDFYQHLGSEFRKGWNVMQISGENLRHLASQSQ